MKPGRTVSKVFTLFAFLVLWLPAARAQAAENTLKMTTPLWRADLSDLAQQLKKRHKNAFHKISEAEFTSAVNHLNARIPSLHDDEIILEFMRLVAMIGDGHTRLRWGPLAETGVLPVVFYAYKDGIFVQKASPELSDIVGAKVIKVGNTSIENAMEIVAPYISRDNSMGLKASVPAFLSVPRILRALKLSDSADKVRFTIERNGKQSEIEMRPTARLADLGSNSASWTDARLPDKALPRWQRDQLDNYWSEYVTADKLYYIQFNAVENKRGESIEHFFAKAFDVAEKSAATKLVLDLRLNGGGNNALIIPIIKGVVRSRFDVKGRFFVIIGRETFSAAQNCVNQLEKYTNAVFVGEPTGASPNSYGDARPFQLPNSKLTIQASTLWWQDVDPRDTRAWTAPDVAAELTSADYREGRDPAIEAIENYQPTSSLDEIVAEARRTGDLKAFVENFRRVRSDPAHRFVDSEATINRVGYILLNAGRIDDAITLFNLNVESYPKSANVYDSLGEAYEKKGDKENALANYRKALSIDANLASALAAVKRLAGR